MIKRSFYFLRHGETTETSSGILQGQIDTSLSEHGRSQAEGVIDLLRQFPIDHIIASPLKRVVETAEIINAVLKKPIDFDDRLIEKSYGLFEGRNKVQIDQWKKKYDFQDGPAEPETGLPVPPQGEEFAPFRDRVMKAITEQMDRHPNKAILFLSHPGVLGAIHHTLLKRKTDMRSMQPCYFDYSPNGWSMHILESIQEQMQEADAHA